MMAREQRGARGGPRRGMTALAVLAGLLSAGPLAAQLVGHDPARSPFRDIITRQSLTFSVGTFLGNRAEAGVGAQQGAMFGVRLRTALSGPIDLMLTSALVQSKRSTIDATQPPATRVGGPIDLRMVVSDIAIVLNLSGTKSWHGLAPYAGVGVGLVAPTRTPVDPGGFRASSGFTFVPTLGLRVLLSRSLGLQFEARDNTIRYEWPIRYFAPIDANGNALTPILDPATTRNKQLTHNFSLTAGLTYHFNF